MKKIHKLTVSISVATLMLGCGNSNNKTNTDTTLQNLLSPYNLSGNALKDKVIPDILDPKPQLGMRLFFSKSLGGDRDSACVTCHHPSLGGGDNLSLPIGVGAQNPDLLGPGRLHDISSAHHDGGPTVPRNAPTTFNLAAWNKVLFHDGRLETLADGIRTPDSQLGTADPLAGTNLAMAQSRFPIEPSEK